MSESAKQVHPVDEILPLPKLFSYGLQHVLAMYAGAVAVPIILANALGLSTPDLIRLINADLFACGIATLIQTIGIGPVGARIPMIQGVTFASVVPMIIIGTEHGLPAVYGAIIVAGIFTFFIAPYFSRLIRLFPPVVTGTIVTIIGISLMPVAIMWIAGVSPADPNYASSTNLWLAGLTLLIVVLVNRFTTGFLSNLSVLIGLLGGTMIAYALGEVNFIEVTQADWLGLVTPLAFGMPTFDVSSIIAMLVVMSVCMVETTGDAIAIGEIVDKKVDKKTLSSCLQADGLSTCIGGFLNSFPYTAFAQNIGLIAVTNVKSRFVVATSGMILMVLGLFPKLAAVVASIPSPVLGGAGIAMFGMIIASGIRSLGKVDYENNHNLMIVALSIGVAMIPIGAPQFYHNFPPAAKIIFESGITFGSILAVVLNMVSNGLGQRDIKR